MSWVVSVGDVRRGLDLPDNSIDAVVCDPPYELGFMGKRWDASGVAYSVAVWRDVLRVLKPGGHLLAFGGTRTYHRMACAIEDAGFEIRDSIDWIYATGFPKSLDVSKAIEAKLLTGGSSPKHLADAVDATGQGIPSNDGVGLKWANDGTRQGLKRHEPGGWAATTPEAKQWQGWGSALKPAHEPIVVARKPLSGTVAANVLAHGTGGLNVDACRVATDWSERPESWKRSGHSAKPDAGKIAAPPGNGITCHDAGRFPPNVLLTHAPECTETACVDGCPVREMGEQSGVSTSTDAIAHHSGVRSVAKGKEVPRTDRGHSDTGTAARFFPCFRYEAKASTAEREAGCEALPVASAGELTGGRAEGSDGLQSPRAGAGRTSSGRRNTHPTVKPVALMRWLVRLVTPPGGTVLDPFTGSGTTGIAAVLEGVNFVGFELDDGHADIARARIADADVQQLLPLFMEGT
jgi:hypothetical protein